MAKETVYTESVVADMVERYTAVRDEKYEVRANVVKELASELGVHEASVRGKLKFAGVYVSKEAENADKETAQTKASIVAALSAVVGKEVKSFEKASKADLETLWGFIRNMNDQFELESSD